MHVYHWVATTGDWWLRMELSTLAVSTMYQVFPMPSRGSPPDFWNSQHDPRVYVTLIVIRIVTKRQKVSIQPSWISLNLVFMICPWLWQSKQHEVRTNLASMSRHRIEPGCTAAGWVLSGLYRETHRMRRAVRVHVKSPPESHIVSQCDVYCTNRSQVR